MDLVVSAGPPGLALVAVALLVLAVFRKTHDHETGRGLNFSIYLRIEDREILDRLRGEQNVSSYFRDLLRKQDARGDAAAVALDSLPPALKEGAEVPPLLRDAMVQHGHSRLPSGVIEANATMIHPSKKAAEDTEKSRASFSIRHDLRGDRLPASAVVMQGHHRLQPSKCSACLLVLRDAYSWC